MLRFGWGEETHFIEKLIDMYLLNQSNDFFEIIERICKCSEYGINIIEDKFAPKLHTIRNQSDRFKVGMFIQPFVWTYKPYKRNPDPLIPAQFDFMPALQLVSKQKFEIVYDTFMYQKKAFIFIDDRKLHTDEIEELAINDGFKNADHFLKHFNKPVENMEIRHFTNLRY